jgi:hypothetical protein
VAVAAVGGTPGAFEEGVRDITRALLSPLLIAEVAISSHRRAKTGRPRFGKLPTGDLSCMLRPGTPCMKRHDQEGGACRIDCLSLAEQRSLGCGRRVPKRDSGAVLQQIEACLKTVLEI